MRPPCVLRIIGIIGAHHAAMVTPHTYMRMLLAKSIFFGTVTQDKDKVTHWQPGHTTHINRQTTSIQ